MVQKLGTNGSSSAHPLKGVGKAMKPFDLFGMIKRYAMLTIVSGGIMIMCMVPLVLKMSKPFYLTSGRIIINRVVKPSLTRTESTPITNYFYDFAQTEVQRLQLDSVLTQALETLPPEAMDIYAPHGPNPGAVARLRSQLTVGLIPSTHLILVQLYADQPDGLAQMTNAIMEAYIQHAERTEESRDARRLSYLLEERNRFKREVESLTARLSALAEETRTSSFVETYNMESLKLIELQENWIMSHKDRLEKENTYKEAIEKAERIRNLSMQALADELVAGDESLWSISYWTYKTMQEMRSSVDGITQDNPDRKYVEERMRDMQAYETDLKNRVEKRALRIVTDKRNYELVTELLNIREAYLAALKTEQQLEEQLNATRKLAAENSRRIISGQDLSSSLTHMREQLYDLERRITEIQAEAKSPIRVSIEQIAQQPSAPAGNNMKKLLILAFVASFGSIGMFFALIDFTDPRIRSSKDIQSATGSPPSWPISAYAGQSPFHLVTRDDSNSQAARALRSLALRLNNERVSNGARTIVFSGASRSTGNTSILVNVARCLSGFCDKVLVVEATQSNSMRQMLTIEGEEGASSCLAGSAAFTDCLYRPQGEPFHVLPAAEKWTSDRNAEFGRLIEQYGKDFDFVLLDCPPVLSSDLTEFLLLGADVAVIVVQGDRTEYKLLRQVLEITVRLKIPAISVALNWGSEKSLNLAERLLSYLPRFVLRLFMPHMLRGRYMKNTKGRNNG